MNKLKVTKKLVTSDTKWISKNIRRLTFTYYDQDFVNNQNGDYIKLLFKEDKLDSEKILVRPYTVRKFRNKEHELDIDFTIHGQNVGYASSWAYNAKIGDEISITGPSPKPKIDKNSSWFFFIGDMSALPVISTYLEELPSFSKGIVVIEIISEEDKIELKKPKNISINWVINDEPSKQNNYLLEFVKSCTWLSGQPYVWVACEFNNMKSLRRFFQKEKGIDKQKMYISSYWKVGLDQEEHKEVKKTDSINWN